MGPGDLIRTTVGRNVRLARRRAELSQRQLAERLDVARTRVADWEAGRHEPNGRHLVAICAATFAPSVGWFYDEHVVRGEDASRAPSVSASNAV